MRMVDLIRKKREGGELTAQEISFFVSGVVSGSIPDYQTTAMLMAMFFRGMTQDETCHLTYAMRDSGDVIDLSDIPGIKADKHSSGGVGDKTTLIVAPIVAACGIKVAKMSGRGLGHTGGTIDKLESIPGFNTTLTGKRFREVVNSTGLSVVGQSGNLAPADKIIYALRDVTATVDSMPLIVSSIMSKKLASGADVIVLDVKVGSGAFMKTLVDATELARQMVRIGHHAGKKMMAVLSNMDVPLGQAIGNSLEVVEAIQTLKGHGPADLVELCIELAACMLYRAGRLPHLDDCRALASDVLHSGKAYDAFHSMVQAQGGDIAYIDNPDLFAKSPYVAHFYAPQTGYIASVNTEDYGRAALVLGAGRATKGDAIDPLAGIMLHYKTGDRVEAGKPIATLYTAKPAAIDEAIRLLIGATTFCDSEVLRPEVVLGIVK